MLEKIVEEYVWTPDSEQVLSESFGKAKLRNGREKAGELTT